MIKNRDLAQTLYVLFYVLAFLFIFVFNIYYSKNYKISKKKALAYSVVSYALIFGWAYVLAWVINGFEWGHHNAIRVYIWFPLVLFLIGKLFKVGFRESCEFMAPSTCFVYGIARLGCNFTGCCYGIPAKWGIYNYQQNMRCFPVQLFEAITSIIIGIIVMRLAKKKGYNADGSLYPIMLVMYGANRFIWELFSAKDRIFLGITELGLWAFGTAVMGIIWLLIIRKNLSKTKND